MKLLQVESKTAGEVLDVNPGAVLGDRFMSGIECPFDHHKGTFNPELYPHDLPVSELLFD